MTKSQNVSSSLTRRALVAAGLAAIPTLAFGGTQPKFRRIRTQYIAALGEPGANRGSGAEQWGLWRKDPGPRGVWLQRFDDLMAAGGRTPAQWTFDHDEWWLDENGLLMEKPVFALPPGRYVVTGNRETAGILTVHPKDFSGDMRWNLDDGVTLHDVTHLECRAVRYRSLENGATCSPRKVDKSAFPVKLGGPMPDVDGCSKVDYTVLFVVGVESTS